MTPQRVIADKKKPRLLWFAALALAIFTIPVAGLLAYRSLQGIEPVQVDNTGEEVSIEAKDTIVPQVRNVNFTAIADTNASIALSVTEQSTVYVYIGVEDDLTLEDILRSPTTKTEGASGSIVAVNLADLTASTDYTVYVVAVDAAGNPSSLFTQKIVTEVATNEQTEAGTAGQGQAANPGTRQSVTAPTIIQPTASPPPPPVVAPVTVLPPTVVPAAVDTAVPVLSSVLSSSVTEVSANLTFTSNEAATAYIVASTYAALTAADIQATATESVAVGAQSVTTRPIISLVADTDYFLYVVATDAAGNVSNIGLAAITTQPDTTVPAVASTSAIRTGPDAASLQITSTESGTGYFLASTSPGLTKADVIANSATTAADVSANAIHSQYFNALTAGDAYYLYAVIEDANGNQSNLIEAVAAPDTMTPVIALAQAVNLTASTVELTFTSSEDGTAYVLASTVAGLNAATIKATATDSFAIDTTGQTHQFTGLMEHTDYVLYVVVEDAGGNTSVAASALATTLDITPPTLSSVSASNPTDTTVDLNFTSDEAGMYYVLASTSANLNAQQVKDDSNAIAGAATAAAQLHRIDGLSEGTDYVVYVVVEDASGNVSAVESLSAATIDITSPSVSSEGVTALTGTTAEFEFTSSEAGTAYVLASTAFVFDSATIVDTAISSFNVDTAPQTHQFTDLISETAYILYVVVVDSHGNTSAIASAAATTLDITPPTLSSVSASNPTDTTVDLNFTSDEAGMYYVLASTSANLNAQQVKDDSNAIAGAATAAAQLHRIDGLSEGTDYVVYVVVEDASGNVSNTADTIVTTLDVTAPVITQINAMNVQATTATLNFTSDEPGTAYVLASTETGLDTAAIIGHAAATTLIVSSGASTHDFTELTSETEYTLYVVVTDAHSNASLVALADATTIDPTAPIISNVSTTTVTEHSVNLLFTASEAGTYYVLASTDTTLNAQQVKDNAATVIGAATGLAQSQVFSELDEATEYTLYLIAEDASTNTSALLREVITTLDVTAPTLTLLTTANLTATSVDLNFTSDEAGNAYLLVSTTDGLNAADVKSNGATVNKTIVAGASTHEFTDLTSETTYTLYTAVEDASGNTSLVGTQTITTTDDTAPLVTNVSTADTTETSTRLQFTASEAGTYYVLASIDTTLNAQQVKDNADASTGTATGLAQTHQMTDLIQGTDYILYVLVEDASANTSNLERVPVTTVSSDITAPVLSFPEANRSTPGYESASLEVTIDEDAVLYHLASTSGGLDSATITADTSTTSTAVTANEVLDHSFSGLSGELDYYLYAVALDAEGNESTVIEEFVAGDPFIAVLATGDSSGVTTEQVFARTQEVLSTSAAEYATECTAALARIYPTNTWNTSNLPSTPTSVLVSSEPNNYPVHIADDNGTELITSYIGEDTGGSKYAVVGGNIFKDSSGSDWSDENVEVTLALLNYVLGNPPGTDITSQNLVILTDRNGTRNHVTDWMTRTGLGDLWQVLSDQNAIISGNESGYDVFISGHAANDITDHHDALGFGKPIIHFQQSTGSFWESNGGDHILDLYGITRRQGASTVVAANGGTYATPTDYCTSGNSAADSHLQLVNNLESDDFDFVNYDDCPISLGVVKCDFDTTVDSDGVSINNRMLTTSQQLRSTIQAYDTNGTNIFTDTTDDVTKLLVVLGDKLRQSVEFPMSKSVADGNDFYRSYFADHVVHYARGNNQFQADVGNFDPNIAAINTLPTTSCSITQTPTSHTEASAMGCYAPPGKPITVARTDNGADPVRIFVNYLYAGTTRVWNENSDENTYSRPAFVQSTMIEVQSGQTITFSTPYGGPIYAEWDGIVAPVDFALEFDGVTQHPYIDSFDAASIADFAADLQTNPHNWIDIKTDAFEMHAHKDNLDRGLSMIDNDETDAVTIADITEIIEDTSEYTVNSMLRSVGYSGGGLGPLEPSVLATCATHGIDCTDSLIHTLPAKQHANFDLNARGGVGTAGNPFDATWATVPLHWGSLHEHGHNLQTKRTMIYERARSGENSNNTLAYVTRAQYNRDLGYSVFDLSHVNIGGDKHIGDESAYEIIQSAIASAQPPADDRGLWIEGSGLYQYHQERTAFYVQTMIKHGSYDLAAYWYLWDRVFDDAITSDVKWANAKDNLGFSSYTRSDAADITAEDFLYIVTSLVDGRDFANWYETWGVALSTDAKAQVATNGASGAPTLTMYKMNGQHYGNISDIAVPSRERPLDGVSEWSPTAPVLSGVQSSNLTSSSVNLAFMSDEAATYYVLASTDTSLTAAPVVAAGTSDSEGNPKTRFGKKGTIPPNVPLTYTFTGLQNSTRYKLYVVLEDADGNLSTLETKTVVTQ